MNRTEKRKIADAEKGDLAAERTVKQLATSRCADVSLDLTSFDKLMTRFEAVFVDSRIQNQLLCR